MPQTIQTDLWQMCPVYWDMGDVLKTAPSITQLSDTAKKSNFSLSLGQEWFNFIKGVNDFNQRRWDWYTAPDTCPTEGFNSAGKLRQIALAFPGRNVVKVNRIATGKDGSKWAVIESIHTVQNPALVNAVNTPHLVHQVYYVNRLNQEVTVGNYVWDGAKVPLISLDKDFFIPLERLVKITLPKTAKALYSINVRLEPSIKGRIAGGLPVGSMVTIYELRTGNGGIWGRISDNTWIALRYNNNNLTNWRI